MTVLKSELGVEPVQPALAAGPDSPFDENGQTPAFRGVPVEVREIHLLGRPFRLALLQDAAALLDDAEYAREFIEADRAPYGLEHWPAAQILSEFILSGEEGRGRPALDLGCGLGLSALAATLRGWRVTAVDHEPAALRFAEYNARCNGVTVEAFELFDWYHPPAEPQFDRVFAADVLYQRADHLPILGCLDAVLRPGGSALIADPHRGVADAFAALAQGRGWDVALQAGKVPNFENRLVNGRIFILTRRDGRVA
jgi:predicted nicotinamide N-methyase